MGAVSGGPRQIGTVQESVFGCLSLGTTYLNGPIAGVSGVAEKKAGFLTLETSHSALLWLCKWWDINAAVTDGVIH